MDDIYTDTEILNDGIKFLEGELSLISDREKNKELEEKTLLFNEKIEEDKRSDLENRRKTQLKNETTQDQIERYYEFHKWEEEKLRRKIESGEIVDKEKETLKYKGIIFNRKIVPQKTLEEELKKALEKTSNILNKSLETLNNLTLWVTAEKSRTRELKNNVEEMEKEKKMSANEIKSLNEKNENLTSGLDMKNEENTKLEDSLKSLRDEMEKAKEESDKNTTELEDKNKELNTAKEESGKKINELEKERKRLDENLDEVKGENTNLNESLETLKTATENAKKKSNEETTKLMKENEVLTTNLNNMETAKEDLSRKFTEISETNATTTEKLNKKENENTILNQSLEALRIQFSEMKQAKGKSDTKTADLKEKNEELTTKLEGAKRESNKGTAELEELNTNLTNMKKEKDELSGKITKISKENDTTKKSLNDKEKENANLKQKLVTLQEKISVMEQEKGNSDTETVKLKNENIVLNTKLSTKKNELDAEITAMKKSIDEKDQKLSIEKQKNTELKESVDVLQNESDTKKKRIVTLEKEKGKLNTNLSEKRQEITGLKKKISTITKELTETNGEVLESTNKITELENKISQVSTDLKNSRAVRKLDLRSFDEKVEGYQFEKLQLYKKVEPYLTKEAFREITLSPNTDTGSEYLVMDVKQPNTRPSELTDIENQNGGTISTGEGPLNTTVVVKENSDKYGNLSDSTEAKIDDALIRANEALRMTEEILTDSDSDDSLVEDALLLANEAIKMGDEILDESDPSESVDPKAENVDTTTPNNSNGDTSGDSVVTGTSTESNQTINDYTSKESSLDDDDDEFFAKMDLIIGTLKKAKFMLKDHFDNFASFLKRSDSKTIKELSDGVKDPKRNIIPKKFKNDNLVYMDMKKSVVYMGGPGLRNSLENNKKIENLEKEKVFVELLNELKTIRKAEFDEFMEQYLKKKKVDLEKELAYVKTRKKKELLFTGYNKGRDPKSSNDPLILRGVEKENQTDNMKEEYKIHANINDKKIKAYKEDIMKGELKKTSAGISVCETSSDMEEEEEEEDYYYGTNI